MDSEPLCVLVYFSCTLLSGFSTLCAVRAASRWGVNTDTHLFPLSCFSAGVFLAVGLLDIIPTYHSEINKTFSDLGVTLTFPVPEFLLAMGFLLVLVMEQVVLSLRDECERQCGQRDGRNEKEALIVTTLQTPPRPEPWFLSVRSFVLLFSLCVFSLFQGLWLQSVQLRADLLLRMLLVSFSLVLTLTQNRIKRPVAFVCLLLLSLAFPLGLALRHALRRVHAPLQLARSTLGGLAVGSFIYMIFLDVIPRVTSGGEQRIVKVTLILTGFAVVSMVMLIKP